jgi:hypothetical protein
MDGVLMALRHFPVSDDEVSHTLSYHHEQLMTIKSGSSIMKVHDLMVIIPNS